jgi:hypothetical protein
MGFISEEDPILAMLEWIAHQMRQIEAEAKVGARKVSIPKRGGWIPGWGVCIFSFRKSGREGMSLFSSLRGSDQRLPL